MAIAKESADFYEKFWICGLLGIGSLAWRSKGHLVAYLGASALTCQSGG